MLLLFLDQFFEGADTLCQGNLDLKDTAGFVAQDMAVELEVEWFRRS